MSNFLDLIINEINKVLILVQKLFISFSLKRKFFKSKPEMKKYITKIEVVAYEDLPYLQQKTMDLRFARNDVIIDSNKKYALYLAMEKHKNTNWKSLLTKEDDYMEKFSEICDIVGEYKESYKVFYDEEIDNAKALSDLNLVEENLEIKEKLNFCLT